MKSIIITLSSSQDLCPHCSFCLDHFSPHMADHTLVSGLKYHFSERTNLTNFYSAHLITTHPILLSFIFFHRTFYYMFTTFSYIDLLCLLSDSPH